MVARMKLHLEDIGPINEANINIGKITIVGGHNSSGKSTLSKFLYSFLRSNSLNREEIAIKSLSESISQLSRYISFFLRRQDKDSRARFPYFRFRETPELDELVEKYEELKSEFNKLDFPEDFYEKVDNQFDKIDNLINITIKNEIPLYISIMKSLLQSEFLTSDFNSFMEIENNCGDESFKFVVDFKNYDWKEDEAFKTTGGFILNDVFYVDSIAILNIHDHFRYSETMSVDHLDFLTDNLVIKPRHVSTAIFDDAINDDIISLEMQIENIIKGKIIFKDSKFVYESDSGALDMINTASGIKQIGIIQVLLANRKLKDDCVLIIDEPEVNLHPEWQFKLANILTLLSKKLDISIYINTHSPLFIEALNTFSDYYDVSDTTTYHLAQKLDTSDRFNINEVPESDLSKIYEELGKPYFDMDLLRLEKELD